MRCIWLVYEGHNVARNQFFIDRWADAAKQAGISVVLVLEDDLTYGIRGNRPFLQHQSGLCLPDAAVMRLNRPILTAHLELMGVPVFNNEKVARICNDKRLTHQFIAGVAPMMDTVFLRGDEKESPFPYPAVVKAAHGCGGRQVFLAQDAEAFMAALSAIYPDSALVQPLCDTPGADVRIYVLGNRIRKVMMRRSANDFRSNLNQGGDAVPYELGQDTLRTVHDIISLFDFGLVGVDFIIHQGRLVFNEIEDAAGTRMLYASGIDIVREYLEYIIRRIS